MRIGLLAHLLGRDIRDLDYYDSLYTSREKDRHEKEIRKLERVLKR